MCEAIVTYLQAVRNEYKTAIAAEHTCRDFLPFADELLRKW